MALGPLSRRTVALGTTSLLLLGGAPLANAALNSSGPAAASGAAGAMSGAAAAADAAAPMRQDVSPNNGAYVKPGTAANPTKVSATFDSTLGSQSTIQVFDVNQGQVAGKTSRSGDTITFTPDEPLADGAFTVKLVASDADNTTSSSTSFGFTVDSVAPAAPTVDVPAFVQKSLRVSGKAEALADVTVTVSGTVAGARATRTGTDTANGDGVYSGLVDVSDFEDGSLTVTAVQADRAGNTSPMSAASTTRKDTTGTAQPTIVTDPKVVGKADETSVKVSGVVEDAVRVVLTVTDGTKTTAAKTQSVGSDSAYSFTGVDVSGLADGELTFRVTAFDDADNEAANTLMIPKDTVAPAAVTGVTVKPSPINAVNQDAVTVSGSAPAGTTVDVTATDSKGTVVKFPAAKAEGGTFETTPTSVRRSGTTAIADGILTVKATATDPAGNTGPADTTTVKKDTNAPAEPTITAPDINAANEKAYVVKGTSTPGSDVKVVLSDTDPDTANVTKTVMAGDDGSYSTGQLDTTTLKEGDIRVTAVASDAAGNASDTSTQVVKDTVKPAAPAGADLTPKPLVASSDGSVPAKVTGTVADPKPGDTVVVSISDVPTDKSDVTTVTSDPVKPDSDGSYAVTQDIATLDEGKVVASAFVVDAAGNRSEPATDSAQKNTLTLALVNAAPKDGGTVRSSGFVTGTFNEVLDQDNSTVQVRNAGGTLLGGTTRFEGERTIVFDSNQQFSDAGSPYKATFMVQDRVGEKKTETVSFTVDSKAPPSVTVPLEVDKETATSFVVSGVAEQGATLDITVTDSAGNKITKTATATNDGSYATPAFSVAGLKDGTLTTSVVATYSDGVVSRTGTGTTKKDTSTTASRSDLLAVTSQDKEIKVRTTPNGFVVLPGTIKSAPAIVSNGGTTYFLGVGKDDTVRIRTQDSGYQRISPRGTECQDVSAAAIGEKLAVACRSASGRLIVGRSILSSTGASAFSQFTDFGGSMLSNTGPAVSGSSKGFRYTIVSKNNIVKRRSGSSGFGNVSDAPTCFGTPTVDGIGHLLACIDAARALQVRSNSGSGFKKLGGKSYGRIGVAVDPDEVTRYYSLRSDGTIMVASQSANGALTGFTPDKGKGLLSGGITVVSKTQ